MAERASGVVRPHVVHVACQPAEVRTVVSAKGLLHAAQ